MPITVGVLDAVVDGRTGRIRAFDGMQPTLRHTPPT
jgi:hypothetical protein